MKPGTKKWARMIRNFFFLSRGICAVAILLIVLAKITDIGILEQLTPAIGAIGFGLIGLYAFMAAFAPIHEMPNWEIVFPELRKK